MGSAPTSSSATGSHAAEGSVREPWCRRDSLRGPAGKDTGGAATGQVTVPPRTQPGGLLSPASGRGGLPGQAPTAHGLARSLRAVPAAARGLPDPARGRACTRGRLLRPGRLGGDLGRRGLRRLRSRRSGRDRARRRLPGQPRPASFGAVPGRSAGPRGRPCPAAPALPAPALRRGLGDRLGLAGALPRAPRRPGLDDADQGNAARRGDRRPARVGEGRRRARDDRRSGAERPLSRLPSRERVLAGADGRASARRRQPPRLHRRGTARSPTSACRSSSRASSRAARSPARRRSRRSITSRRSSRSGEAPRWAPSARSTRTATSS